MPKTKVFNRATGKHQKPAKQREGKNFFKQFFDDLKRQNQAAQKEFRKRTGKDVGKF